MTKAGSILNTIAEDLSILKAVAGDLFMLKAMAKYLSILKAMAEDLSILKAIAKCRLAFSREENASEEKIVFEAFDFLSENNKLSLHEQERFYTLMDCNRDGTVSKVEAKCMFKEYSLGLPAFIASADDDDDGFITNEEYKSFFSAIDANNNNRVTWGEFQTAWTDFQNSK